MMADQSTHALLIGINRYAHMSEAAQLNGCVNDVRSMADILSGRFGFSNRNITVLTDRQATRSGILTAMDDLLQRVEKDDLVVVCYSGHGSRMRDREGDKPDGWDQTIVPHDSGRKQHPNRDITDDEIYSWLLELSAVTPYIALIFDSCYSGSIARDPFAAKVRWLEADQRPVEELPPSPVPAGSAMRSPGPSGWLPLSNRYVLLAACRGDEHCFEIKVDGVAHGALTYFVAQELVEAAGETTYRDIFERCSGKITAIFSRQHPQLEGMSDRQVFGLKELIPFSFLPVTERDGNRIVLGGGAAHGLTVGSQWALYPATTKSGDEVARQGLVELRAVHAVSAEAVLVEEDDSDPAGPGSRAVEQARAYQLQLAVELASSSRFDTTELEAGIASCSLLRLAEAAEQGQVRVAPVEARQGLRPDDPAPQLGAVHEPSWVVVGRDGELLAPPCPVAAAGAARQVLEILESRARYWNILALQSPDRSLRGCVELVIKRWRSGGWQVAEPEADGGEVVLEEDDRIALAVTNHAEIPLYLSILDLGVSGRISLVYPIEGAREVLPPDRTLELGVREGDELVLKLPQGYPVGDAAGGTEYLKLFATRGELDLSPLTRTSVSSKIAPSAVASLMTAALGGPGLRSARSTGCQADEQWTTVTRSFYLRRASTSDPVTQCCTGGESQ
jgi:hypothetical protein